MALETLNYSQSPPSDCLKKKRSKRHRHDYEQFDDLDYIAECLIQLARGGGGTTIPAQPKKIRHEEKTYHTCTICDRKFSSYQAVGGHMACHRSKLSSSTVEKQNSSTEEISGLNPIEMKLHMCGTCGKSFNTGQALGGHMRRHFKEEGCAAAAVQSQSSSPESIAKPARNFDLNFPPPSESEEGVVESDMQGFGFV